MIIKKPLIHLIFISFLCGCQKEDVNGSLTLNQVFIGSTELDISGGTNNEMPIDQAISLVFSAAVDQPSAQQSITLKTGGQEIDININFSTGDKNISIYPTGTLTNNTVYTISISDQLRGGKAETFEPKEISFKTIIGDLELMQVLMDDKDISTANMVTDVSLDFSLRLRFSFAVDKTSFQDAFSLSGDLAPSPKFVFSDDGKSVDIAGVSSLKYLTKYKITVSDNLKGASGEDFAGYSLTFYSQLDTTPKFPEISDEALLTIVQEHTFKYFWDFGHPVSGLTRERDTSGETVTSGGSGFGMMAILVGIERGFVSRSDGVARLATMIEFLKQADRFHGAWSHWLNGSTGKVIPFSTKDNGGDLVETAYVVMGMLTVRQYLDNRNATESGLIDLINELVEGVEWDWYAQGEKVLTWHWSPNYEWDMNLKIRGWNEALITYVLAASSTTHGIAKEVYDEGWKNSNHFINGKEFYGIQLPLGSDYGGPLFFEHYSFLGIDPRNLQDSQVSYWEQAVNHSLINRGHCIANPKDYVGYSSSCWGLTASDGNNGYSAHSPTNDLGVITPSAALSSIPFTPEASMDAIKHFYYMLGDRLWGPYGFYDAFNVTEGWYATSNIAIDQGPIIIMIENHRTGLLWDLFMSCSEIKQGCDELGFTY